MPDPDLYKVLQVDPEADPEIIQAAYRRLAQRFHPDVAPDAESSRRMIVINRAWEILRNPATREAYDRARVQAARPKQPTPAQDARSAEAMPPPGRPSGSIVGFGRYHGWTLGEIARTDLDYLEWLDRMPIGRPHRDELDALLRGAGRRGQPGGQARQTRGLFRRR
jgi:curved DNA-binding protein CbpA